MISQQAKKMRKTFLFILLLLLSIYGFSQSRYISTTTKKIVYSRDGGMCRCCGTRVDLEYDHIIPFSCGGGNEASNIQLLCMRCNRSKSNSCICKIHNNKVGKNCCSGTSTKSTFTTSTQCTGTTKKGARCRNRTTNSSGRCYLH